MGTFCRNLSSKKVEAFDQAPAGHPNWINWEEPALVFIESGMDINLSKPQQLMNDQLLKKADVGHKTILRTAMVTGLLKSHDLSKLDDVGKSKSHLIKSESDFMYGLSDGTPISSLSQYDFAIRALHATDQLSPEERTFLTNRLKATVRSIVSKDWFFADFSGCLVSSWFRFVFGYRILWR